LHDEYWKACFLVFGDLGRPNHRRRR